MAEGEITITHPERVVFPAAGITKLALADYYRTVAPLMLPHLAKRPVSLVRCPRGRQKRCFYQKHHTGGFGPHVLSVAIAEKDGEREPYIWLDGAAGILECVQMGAIEFHLWGSRVDRLEAPDRMVFDLDPDVGIGFGEVARAASDLRARLADMRLDSFALLTGGKGVHVVVPLEPGHSWDAHRDFARALAQAMADAEPERFTATMSKARRKGKIFIDWLRNARGSTAVAPYAVRAREGAPIAAPVGWNELAELQHARTYNAADGKHLLERAASATLAGWGEASQPLPGS